MDVKRSIRSMTGAAGMTLRDVSRACGRSDGWLGALLRRPGDLTASSIARAADACGYRLALVPADRLPADAVTIDPTHDGDGRPGRKRSDG